MRQTVEFDQKQLGDAVVRYVGKKHAGSIFFPYHIRESTWKPELPVSMSLQLNPNKQPMNPEPAPGAESPRGGEVKIQLTQAEIVEAIWLELPLMTNQSFMKPDPWDISIEIPEEVSFTLSYMPQGSKFADYQHAL